MKKGTIILFFYLIHLNAVAQIGFAGHNDILKFKDQTLYVVLYGDSAYTKLMEDCLRRYWKFNKYQFISQSEIVNIEKYKQKWYLMNWLELSETSSIGDDLDHYFIGIVRPGSSWNLEKGTMVNSYKAVYFPFNFATDWTYLLPNIIQVFQNYLDFASENSHLSRFSLETLSSGGFLKSTSDNYRKGVKDLKSRELWIQFRDFPGHYKNMFYKKLDFSFDDFKKAYGDSVKLVSADDIKAAILRQDDNVVYAYRTSATFMLIEAKGGMAPTKY